MTYLLDLLGTLISLYILFQIIKSLIHAIEKNKNVDKNEDGK